MRIPSLVQIHWCLLKLSSRNKIPTNQHTTDGWMYDWWMDRHTDIQCETIIPRHYRVAGYKNVKSFWMKKAPALELCTPSCAQANWGLHSLAGLIKSADTIFHGKPEKYHQLVVWWICLRECKRLTFKPYILKTLSELDQFSGLRSIWNIQVSLYICELLYKSLEHFSLNHHSQGYSATDKWVIFF